MLPTCGPPAPDAKRDNRCRTKQSISRSAVSQARSTSVRADPVVGDSAKTARALVAQRMPIIIAQALESRSAARASAPGCQIKHDHIGAHFRCMQAQARYLGNLIGQAPAVAMVVGETVRPSVPAPPGRRRRECRPAACRRPAALRQRRALLMNALRADKEPSPPARTAPC